MKSVYIVMISDDWGDVIEAVFSTRRGAEEFIKKEEKKYTDDYKKLYLFNIVVKRLRKASK